MVENRSLYTSIIISLLIHALLIFLIPRFNQVKPEDKIGSYTRVQFIQMARSSAPQKVSKTPQKVSKTNNKQQQSPEMDPYVRDQMETVRDIPVPSFDLPWPPLDEVRSWSPADAAFEDEIMDRLDDEVIDQPEQSLPTPRPVEGIAKMEDDLPELVPDDIEFELEEPVEVEEVKDIPPSKADIKWSGKPRRILYKPDYPPRYPDGYREQVQGRIRLKFWVDSLGEVVRVVPMQKLDPRLDAVATAYLRQYRFEPVSKKRRDEQQWGIIPFSFRLE